jgi:predicted flap endonuclease-1-like 5' DNA nuclease
MAPPRPSYTPPPPRAVAQPAPPAIAHPATPAPPSAVAHPTTPAATPVAPKPAATPAAAPVAPKQPVAPTHAEKPSRESDRAPDPGAGIAKLRMELDDALRAAAAKEKDLRATLEQRDARIHELEASAADLASRIKQVEAAAAEQVSTRDGRIRDLDAALSKRDEQIAKLEQDVQAARAQPGEAGDDLKMIRGIGPAFERELRRLGVHSFAQIAAWTPEDVDSIGPKIKAKPERIRRENWVESAAELATRSPESP